MGLPIIGQVSWPFCQCRICQADSSQHYNLVSLAFYLGASGWALFGAIVTDATQLGFLVWEFPTVYISQKTRVAKYLGNSVPSPYCIQQFEWPILKRRQYLYMGCYTHAPFRWHLVWCIFCTSFSIRSVPLVSTLVRQFEMSKDRDVRELCSA